LAYTNTDPPPKNGSLNSSKSGIRGAITLIERLLPPGYLSGLFIKMKYFYACLIMMLKPFS